MKDIEFFADAAADLAAELAFIRTQEAQEGPAPRFVPDVTAMVKAALADADLPF